MGGRTSIESGEKEDVVAGKNFASAFKGRELEMRQLSTFLTEDDTLLNALRYHSVLDKSLMRIDLRMYMSLLERIRDSAESCVTDSADLQKDLLSGQNTANLLRRLVVHGTHLREQMSHIPKHRMPLLRFQSQERSPGFALPEEETAPPPTALPLTESDLSAIDRYRLHLMTMMIDLETRIEALSVRYNLPHPSPHKKSKWLSRQQSLSPDLPSMTVQTSI